MCNKRLIIMAVHSILQFESISFTALTVLENLWHVDIHRPGLACSSGHRKKYAIHAIPSPPPSLFQKQASPQTSQPRTLHAILNVIPVNTQEAAIFALDRPIRHILTHKYTTSASCKSLHRHRPPPQYLDRSAPLDALGHTTDCSAPHIHGPIHITCHRSSQKNPSQNIK